MPFKRPTTTPVPDELFDLWLKELSEGELKVLLYIIRRTLGFKKNHDAISIDQFLHGITTADGRVLDKGCMGNRTNLMRALARLEERELIRRVHRETPAGRDVSTLYALWFEGDEPFLEAADPRAGKPADEGYRKSTPPTGGGYRKSTLTAFEGYRKGTPEGTAADPEGVPAQHPQQTDQQTDSQESRDSKTSNPYHPAKRTEEPARLATYSALISQITRDYSRLFHDQAHERSNRSRALHLWAESGLTESDFVGLLHEARRIAQARGDIAKDADDGSPAGTKNRMPYFFTVVEDLMSMATREKHG